MGNNLAVTGNVTIGGTLVVTGTTNLGAAADTVLVTNFNADKVDGADLSVDGTLAANSDVLVPSQKAVKTYADLRALDNAVVKLTGNQTIAGVKTFSSAPLFPADTVETADIQALAVTQAKIAKAFDSGGSEVIGASSSWTLPAGIYMWCESGGYGGAYIHVYQGGAWRGLSSSSTSGDTGGMIITDGTNIRIRNNRVDVSITIHYLKLA